jgi:hypothetical protein
MASILLPGVVFALLIGIVHHLGERIDHMGYRHKPKITSFSAGAAVAYLFLQLFPELEEGVSYLGNYTFLYALFGFASIHMAEKWIYQHERTFEDLKKDFKELHSIFLFSYYFAIGVVIQYLLGQSIVRGTLFFIPVFLHTAISSLALHELHEDVLEKFPVKIAISAASLLGVLVSFYFHLEPSTFFMVLGTVTGMFFYVVTRDAIPSADNGTVQSFFIGLVFYAFIIIVTWGMA